MFRQWIACRLRPGEGSNGNLNGGTVLWSMFSPGVVDGRHGDLPMKRIRRSLRDRVAGFAADWSLPRQLAGQNVMSDAASSRMSRSLRPRVEQADRVGTSICPFCA